MKPTTDKTEMQTPEPFQQMRSSIQHESIKPSRITLTKLVKIGRSFITSKLRGQKQTRSDQSNLTKSNRSPKVKTVYVPVDKKK